MSRQADAYRMNVSGHRRSSSDQEAILKYEVLSVIDDYQLWAIELVTGRRHQIRAQLAHIGAPIVGDKNMEVKCPQIRSCCTVPICSSNILLKNKSHRKRLATNAA